MSVTVARGRGVENPDNFVDVMCEWCHGCAAQSANAKKERRERGKTDGRRKEGNTGGRGAICIMGSAAAPSVQREPVPIFGVNRLQTTYQSAQYEQKFDNARVGSIF